tara:strand:- start:21 stop:890 length:870 start_codon:yes stop_codon:yes gene_type:complete
VKYFNVVFWVALIGIIFYFTIDSRDLKTGIENFNKDVVEPIDNKFVELTGIETSEMFVKKKITGNENAILQIETNIQYFCDPNFSLEDACLKLYAEITVNGKNEFCDNDYGKKFIKNSLGVRDEDEDKNQESCELLKEESETKISLMKSEIEELELVLSEGTASEYVKTQKAIEEKEAEEKCTPAKIRTDPKCLKEYRETEQKKITIIDEWYESQKNNEDFKKKINEAKTNIPSNSSAGYNWEIVTDVCRQMVLKNKKVIEMFDNHMDRYHEFCGISYEYFKKKVLNTN